MQPPDPYAVDTRPFSAWTVAAALVACATAGGSVALSLAEGKIPCPLCFYQRAFAFGTVAVLFVGMVSQSTGPGRIALLALPLAGAGLGVAGFHVNLEMTGKLECPPGLFGVLTAPKQSAAAFALLTVLLLLDVLRGLRAGTVGAAGLALAVLLAGGATWASANTNMKQPYKFDYSKETPDICRPPKPPEAQ
jgi:disulfide bond formation protein DsbB